MKEYYLYNPDANDLAGFQRQKGELTAETLQVYYPDGQRFLSTVELADRAEAAEADNARLRSLLAAAGIEV